MTALHYKLALIAFFTAAIICNGALWFSLRNEKIAWQNVPPPPSLTGALLATLGDPQFAYRLYGLTLQNMGDTGGKSIRLADFDYEALSEWFLLQHKLDPKSDFTPLLAGNVFGGSQDPDKLQPLIDYLEQAAGDGQGEKWRFMARAVYLARYRKNDLDQAMTLATKLSSYKNRNMPSWAYQLPVYILNAKGEKQAAYEMMINLLKTESEHLHPNEVNSTIVYICEQILTPEEAKGNKLCQNKK